MSASIILVPLCCSIILSAAPAPLGILTTAGPVQVDGVTVRGNGTVLKGSLVETANNPSQIILTSGIRFDLAAQSRARIYDDHVVLELGASQIHSSNGYATRVNSLDVVPVGPSTIRVFRTNAGKLQVAAATGQAEVRNSNGYLIAKVFPGAPLDFEQTPAGAAGATLISGKLEKRGGRYVLTDVATKATLELQGDNLEKSVGQCISGAGSSDPTTEALIHVATYANVPCKKLGIAAEDTSGAARGGAAGSGAPAAGGGAAAGAAGGLSTGVLTAIAVGGAVVGSLAGAAAGGVFTGGTSTPVSAP